MPMSVAIIRVRKASCMMSTIEKLVIMKGFNELAVCRNSLLALCYVADASGGILHQQNNKRAR
jgi:hypothetical protein